MSIDFIRLFVLNPVGGFGEKEKFAVITIIHARARHAVTDGKVLHAQKVYTVPTHNAAKLTRQA